MKKLALNFICKNESHVIERMLRSVVRITDLIVAVDTGSTDNTIDIIRDFGAANNIPTYVFERPFDNFCNSRNYALEMLRDVVIAMSWPPENTWGFWIDCDEVMVIAQDFERSAVDMDIHYVVTKAKAISFTKQLFFRMSMPVSWVGPVHEYMMCSCDERTEGVIEGIYILYEEEGASWTGDLVQKFLNYAHKLQDYVKDGNRAYRWVYYIGESYSAAANQCRDERQKDLYLKARQYYQDALGIDPILKEERYHLLQRIADNRYRVGEDWHEVRSDFFAAYSASRIHAEPIVQVAEYYMQKERWNTAYLFLQFAYAQYHDHPPSARGLIEAKEVLYKWKILFLYYYVSARLLRKKEAWSLYDQLNLIIKEHPDQMDQEMAPVIKYNSPPMIFWQARKELLKKSIGRLKRKVVPSRLDT